MLLEVSQQGPLNCLTASAPNTAFPTAQLLHSSPALARADMAPAMACQALACFLSSYRLLLLPALLLATPVAAACPAADAPATGTYPCALNGPLLAAMATACPACHADRRAAYNKLRCALPSAIGIRRLGEQHTNNQLHAAWCCHQCSNNRAASGESDQKLLVRKVSGT